MQVIKFIDVPENAIANSRSRTKLSSQIHETQYGNTDA